jgi:hypothetical protein
MNQVLVVASPFGRRGSDRMTKPAGPVSYDGARDWLDELLDIARKVPHKSPTLRRALNLFEGGPVTSHRLAYARFLDETIRVASDYSRLVTQHGGVPIEWEMKSVYGDRWAFIQSAKTIADCSTWTVIFFDRKGVQFERQFTSAADALNVMVDDGYVLSELHAMFTISTEEAWMGGAQSARSPIVVRSRSTVDDELNSAVA